jgi:hypothetical protein
VSITDYEDYETYVHRESPIADFGSFLSPAMGSAQLSLSEQLQKLATSNKEVIITIATNHFTNLLLNWLCSLAALHSSSVPPLKHLLIYTVDADFAKTLINQYGISPDHIYVDQKLQTNNEELNYDTKDYQMLMVYRTEFIQRVLNMGYRVLLADSDTVWFQSPLPYINKHYKNMDLVAQNDDPNPVLGIRTIICGGFLYLNNTNNMKKHWDIVTSRHSQQIMEHDSIQYTEQDILNQYRKSLKVQLLPWQHYPSGSSYFSHTGHIQSVYPNVHVVHNNWVIGKNNKMNRFYSLKGFLWLLSSSSPLPGTLSCNYKKRVS